MDVGKVIRQARNDAGLSIQAAADRVGISKSYYEKIECGNRRVYMDLLEKICEVLNLQIEIKRKTE